MNEGLDQKCQIVQMKAEKNCLHCAWSCFDTFIILLIYFPHSVPFTGSWEDEKAGETFEEGVERYKSLEIVKFKT